MALMSRNQPGLPRRALGGLALAGMAVVARRARPAEQPGPIMAELSAYMAAAPARPLPEEAAEAARHHLLDTFAAMVSGAELPPGRQALRFAEAHGAGPATVAAST